MSGAVLEVDGLSRRFGSIVALDDMSFSVAPGTVVGFLGPNGAGKTTAMRTILGISEPDAGSVRWRGHELTIDDRRRFGYLPEERGLYPGMPVAEQLTYLGRLHGLTKRAAETAAADWLDRFGLSARAGDKLEALSLGNQQRVQLAGALVHSPELLVLDEPFSGLDPVAIDTLGQTLHDIAAGGVAVLFSSHQLDLVEDMCESVIIVNRGRVVATGSVDELGHAGPRRYVVVVEGDRSGRWTRFLPGVRVASADSDGVHLVLDKYADPQLVLAEAQAAGPVTLFARERRRLSDVFREVVSA